MRRKYVSWAAVWWADLLASGSVRLPFGSKRTDAKRERDLWVRSVDEPEQDMEQFVVL